MRIVVHGQQAFGKSVLEALLERKENVVGVYCGPDPAQGGRVDPLKEAALARNLPVFQPRSFRNKPEVWEEFARLKADLCVMAYVTLIVPEEVLNQPTRGTIQYHPSLLPKYRGPSSINWPIIKGEIETGLTIFRPSDGLDEGAVILQKKTPLSTEDTLGTVYFDRLFPLGVSAMLEAADLVVAGKHTETVQDESQASYEGWCRTAEARIDWAKPIDHVYNLIRGCNPAPGAWTTHNGKKLQIFDARKILFRRFADVTGKIGEVTDVSAQSFKVTAQGGVVEVLKARFEDGKKLSGGEVAQSGCLTAGTLLGT